MRALLRKPLACGLIAFLLTLAACVPLFCADQPPLPGAAQAALDKAAMDIVKVRQSLVVALTKAQDAATKKGDLEGALAIKDEIAKQNTAIDAVDLMGNTKGGTAGGNGIRIKSEGTPDVMWDNQSSIQISTSPHTLSFFVKLPKASKTIWLRAKKGYGDERIILNIDGKSELKMAKEYSAAFVNAKEVFKVTGEHRGSNDAFSYGPLQYKMEVDGDWTDIPAGALAPGK